MIRKRFSINIYNTYNARIYYINCLAGEDVLNICKVLDDRFEIIEQLPNKKGFKKYTNLKVFNDYLDLCKKESAIHINQQFNLIVENTNSFLIHKKKKKI